LCLCVFALVLPLILAVDPKDPKTCLPSLPQVSCLSVSDAASFVSCNTTTTKCYCLPTFEGNASPRNPCTCPSPKTVWFPTNNLGGGFFSDSNWVPTNWGFGDPECINLAELQARQVALEENLTSCRAIVAVVQTEALKQAKHKASVIQFFNNTIYPTPFTILESNGTTLTTLLAPNVKARISPAGSFDGFAGVMEYFYGFVATPGTQVLSVDYISLATTGNTAAAKANVFIRNDNYVNTNGHPPQFFNLSIFAFFTFNSQDLIQSIDVSVPNLGVLLTPTDQPTQNAIKIVTCQVLTQPHFLNNFKAGGACAGLNTFGTNVTGQYDSCIDVMQSKPFGTHDRINGDNFVCRQLHMLLARYDPVLHCPHCAADGGGACINYSYESFFQQTY